MGGGSYSYNSSVDRSTSRGWASEHAIRKAGKAVPTGYRMAASNEIFRERRMNDAMDPRGLKIRESRDSAEHPESVAIVIGLDETGSMGTVPLFLVREGFPHLMDKILKAGLKDPQVLFLGIGDHENDSAPLQVGQFESSDELLDKWLTSVYLEGAGGGNDGESYALAWFLAGRYTSIDCLEKRNQKGLLFTIGDEPVLKNYPARVLEALMGHGQYSDETAQTLLAKAREKYEVFHVHIQETTAGAMTSTVNGWKQLLQDHLLLAQSHSHVAEIIAETIVKTLGKKTASDVQTVEEAKLPEEML